MLWRYGIQFGRNAIPGGISAESRNGCPSSRWDRRPNQRLRWRSCGAYGCLGTWQNSLAAKYPKQTSQKHQKSILLWKALTSRSIRFLFSTWFFDIARVHGFPSPVGVESKWGQGSRSSPTGLLAGSQCLRMICWQSSSYRHPQTHGTSWHPVEVDLSQGLAWQSNRCALCAFSVCRNASIINMVQHGYMG